MRHAASLELFHYWNRLRDGRAAPRRSEIKPADIKSLLPDTVILGKAEETIFRLAGTRLCATYGRELKGLPFRSLFPNNDRLVASLVSRVMEVRSVVVIGSEAVSRDGRCIAFEALLLPLDAGESQRSLGVISPREEPFWLGTDPLTQTRFKSVRIIDPDGEPVFENRPSMITSSSVSPKAFAFSQPPLVRTLDV